MKFIDLTQTISHQIPVFPGEARPSLVRDELPEDTAYVTYRLESNMHTGTHIDAPFHVKSDALGIDSYPVKFFSGSAVVIDVRNLPVVSMKQEWEPLFLKHNIVLFCTGFSRNWEDNCYYYDYPEFKTEVAEALLSCGVRIAGFDSPSPDKAPFAFHSIFLKEARFLVENLSNLEELLSKDNITFMAFPLKMESEASLVRAVAIIEE